VNVGPHAELVDALRRPRAGRAVTATEAECQRTIVDAARLAGWLVHHTRPARTVRGWRTPLEGDAGFPDLVLARRRPPGRLLVVELKRAPRQPTDEQRAWLAALTAAGVDARLVYVPDDLDALLAELVHNPSPTERPTP